MGHNLLERVFSFAELLGVLDEGVGREELEFAVDVGFRPRTIIDSIEEGGLVARR